MLLLLIVVVRKGDAMKHVVCVLVLGLVSAVGAEEFYLDDADGKTHGPFELKKGIADAQPFLASFGGRTRAQPVLNVPER